MKYYWVKLSWMLITTVTHYLLINGSSLCWAGDGKGKWTISGGAREIRWSTQPWSTEYICVCSWEKKPTNQIPGGPRLNLEISVDGLWRTYGWDQKSCSWVLSLEMRKGGERRELGGRGGGGGGGGRQTVGLRWLDTVTHHKFLFYWSGWNENALFIYRSLIMNPPKSRTDGQKEGRKERRPRCEVEELKRFFAEITRYIFHPAVWPQSLKLLVFQQRLLFTADTSLTWTPGRVSLSFVSFFLIQYYLFTSIKLGGEGELRAARPRRHLAWSG